MKTMRIEDSLGFEMPCISKPFYTGLLVTAVCPKEAMQRL